MAKGTGRRSSASNDDQPKFTTPRMLSSKRSESKIRLRRMRYGSKRRREFNSGKFTAFILALTVVLLFSLMLWLLLHKNAQAVIVNSEQVAYIKDINTTTEEFNSLLTAKLKERTGNNVLINETVSLDPVHVSRKKVDSNTENVITNLCNTLTYKQEAAIITVNGEEKAVLATKQEAESLLDQILELYKNGQSDVVDVSFADKVEVGSRFVDAEEVMTTVKASDVLRASTKQAQVYTVKSGDSFSGIAANADMSADELLAANPAITRETMGRLQIGQEINITVSVPVLSVRVVKEEKDKNTVSRVTYLNGREESRETVSESTSSEG